jgi:hypothetical protein
VKTTCGAETTGGRPSPARGVVQKALASCEEHLAVRQQRRRGGTGSEGEATGGRPGSARRIVQFRELGG